MVDRLMMFGLTRQEATIYITLAQTGAMTGYEVAKVTGISRSNVYSALAGLVEKGAANRMEGASNKYLALGVEEMCENKLRAMTEAKSYLAEHLILADEAADGYITIDGFTHIQDKVFKMLMLAEKRVYLALQGAYIPIFEKELKKLLEEGKKVVLLTDTDCQIEGAQIYLTNQNEQQIHLIVDSCHVLTGDFTKSPSDTCLYTGQKNFVTVLKQALRNEIRLIELGEEK